MFRSQYAKCLLARNALSAPWVSSFGQQYMFAQHPLVVVAAVAAGSTAWALMQNNRKMAVPLRLGRHAAFLKTDDPFVLFMIGHNFPSLLSACRAAVMMGLRGNPLQEMEDEALKDLNSGLLHVEGCVANRPTFSRAHHRIQQFSLKATLLRTPAVTSRPVQVWELLKTHKHTVLALIRSP